MQFLVLSRFGVLRTSPSNTNTSSMSFYCHLVLLAQLCFFLHFFGVCVCSFYKSILLFVDSRVYMSVTVVRSQSCPSRIHPHLIEWPILFTFVYLLCVLCLPYNENFFPLRERGASRTIVRSIARMNTIHAGTRTDSQMQEIAVSRAQAPHPLRVSGK